MASLECTQSSTRAPESRNEELTIPKQKLLIGLSGSVATVKWAELATALAEFFEVRIVLTKSAQHFFDITASYDPSAFAVAQQAGFTSGPPLLWQDEDEWRTYSSVHEDTVVHIDLRNWADAMLLAPLSANTLAKVSSGACDNLLTCIARAWPFKNEHASGGDGGSGPRLVAKPFLVAPAMNCEMWDHPVTAGQIGTLSAWGMKVVSPVRRMLACGDVGQGAMAAVDTIVEAVRAAMETQQGVPRG